MIKILKWNHGYPQPISLVNSTKCNPWLLLWHEFDKSIGPEPYDSEIQPMHQNRRGWRESRGYKLNTYKINHP